MIKNLFKILNSLLKFLKFKSLDLLLMIFLFYKLSHNFVYLLLDKRKYKKRNNSNWTTAKKKFLYPKLSDFEYWILKKIVKSYSFDKKNSIKRTREVSDFIYEMF